MAESWPPEDLSVRAFNALQRLGVERPQQLLAIDPVEFAKIPNVGRRTMEELRDLVIIEVGLLLSQWDYWEPRETRTPPHDRTPARCLFGLGFHLGPAAGGDAATIRGALEAGGRRILSPFPDRLAERARQRGAQVWITHRADAGAVVTIRPNAKRGRRC